jgi:hypothetical protein
MIQHIPGIPDKLAYQRLIPAIAKVVKIFLCGLLVAILACAICSMAIAQGGKAEAREIKFKKGSNSGIYSGYIKKSEEAEYSFGAKKDQKVSVKLDCKPQNAASIKMQDPDFHDFELQDDGQGNFHGQLTKSGQYLFSVINRDATTNRTTYSFTITIE